MSYIVDSGNKIATKNEKQLRRYYTRHIDKAEYPTYEDWMWDMMRCGLITPIYGK